MFLIKPILGWQYYSSETKLEYFKVEKKLIWFKYNNFGSENTIISSEYDGHHKISVRGVQWWKKLNDLLQGLIGLRKLVKLSSILLYTSGQMGVGKDQ